jgi:cytidylate kinase
MTALPVVAIDGPAASGKSSTARAVAERLGLVHIDSGALYRVATWVAVRDHLRGEPDILRALAEVDLRLTRRGADVDVRLGGQPVEPVIREPRVTARVSEVAALPGVRAWVDQRLRAAVVEWGGAVMDGRDIGTVVFPDAALKVFLTASPAARAARRLRQDGARADPAAIAAEADLLAARDRLDAARPVAPLRAAPDAHHLDTTELGFAEQVERIVAWAAARGLPAG